MDILQNALKAIVGGDTIYYALLAIGLNIQFGYAGLLNFGQVAFAMVGGFGVASTVVKFHGNYWVGIVIGLLAAVVLALLLGVPTLRLRADYLAIVTIAAAEILRTVFRTPQATSVTNSTSGLFGYSDSFYSLSPIDLQKVYRPLGVIFRGQDLWVLFIGWLLVAATCVLVWLLMRSPWGRVQKAIREDEDAARALGKNVYWYKMQALMLGGAIGALGGIFDATASRSVIPDTYQNAVTFFAYAAVILGGTARVLGPVIGSMIFWALFSVTEDLLGRAGQNIGWLPDVITSESGQGAIRFMLVGVALVLLMAFRPEGIFGDRREVTLDAR